MTELLAEGKEFNSFEELQAAVHKYEEANFAQLSRTDSRTIENELARRNSKSFNPKIKYAFVTFTCAYGGKPYVSRSTGIRNSKPRIKCNCPVILKCFASSNGKKLVVRQSVLDSHNHETTEDSFKSLPRGRLLDEETEMEIYNLIDMHENKKLARKLIKEKLVQETGRDITYKDIQNIEKRMSKKKEKSEIAGTEENDEEAEGDDENVVESAEDDSEDKGKQKNKDENDSKDDKDVTEENSKTEENTGTDEEKNEDEDETAKVEGNKSPKASSSPPKKKAKMIRSVTPAGKSKGKKVKEEQTPASQSTRTKKMTGVSTGRPRREIREPKRFREVKLLVPNRKGKDQIEDSDEESEDEEEASPPPPVKKEPQSASKKGKTPVKSSAIKRKFSGDEDSQDDVESDAAEVKTQPSSSSVEKTKKKSIEHENSAKTTMLEMEERKMAMQEEMLKLQRQSVLLLQNVMERLEKVEAGQNKT